MHLLAVVTRAQAREGMGDPPIRPSVHRKTSSAFCAGIATAHLDQSPARRRRRVSKRAAPRPPPNVVISSAPPLTNAPYGQSGMEVNPSLPSSYWVAREPRMKDARESPPSQNPQGQNICATLYTEREQWTDLSVPKSTRCARPGEERTPLSLSHIPLWRRLLFSKLKIECRRLKQFTSPFRTHVPSFQS